MVVIVGLGDAAQPLVSIELSALAVDRLPRLDPSAALYVIRYMPSGSRFIRDGCSPPNWIAMEEQPLVNYATRPLWLVRGEDRAGNDFVTGFSPPVPRWAGTQPKEH